MMEILELSSLRNNKSSQKQLIYCRIRKEWVVATPEEIVRQRLVRMMIEALGFPDSLIVMEKGLKQMPHLTLTDQNVPDRRADVVCFAKGIHPQHDLYPLLLVECKAVKLTPRVINQVVGYNYFLKACFVSIVNQQEIQTGWCDPASKKYQFVNGLPDFQRLIQLQNNN